MTYVEPDGRLRVQQNAFAYVDPLGPVLIPDGSIESDEILDEPAIAGSGLEFSLTPFNGEGSSYDVLRSQTITVPGPGYVHATFNATASFYSRRANTTTTGFNFGFSTGPVAPEFGDVQGVAIETDQNRSLIIPIFAQKIYRVPEAGTYEAFLVLSNQTETGGIFGSQLILQYFPSAYGEILERPRNAARPALTLLLVARFIGLTPASQ